MAAGVIYEKGIYERLNVYDFMDLERFSKRIVNEILILVSEKNRIKR